MPNLVPPGGDAPLAAIPRGHCIAGAGNLPLSVCVCWAFDTSLLQRYEKSVTELTVRPRAPRRGAESLWPSASPS